MAEKKRKKKGVLKVAIIIGMDKKPDRKNRQRLAMGGQPKFMGNAYPSASDNRTSRGGGDAITGIKFRGVR